ncbi:hypothetical protein [Paenibacillus taichungensis]
MRNRARAIWMDHPLLKLPNVVTLTKFAVLLQILNQPRVKCSRNHPDRATIPAQCQ